jgi:hypothetical protein
VDRTGTLPYPRPLLAYKSGFYLAFYGCLYYHKYQRDMPLL